MSIKQLGGVFGRNPTFNDVTIEGQLTFDGDIDVSSDLKVDGDLNVTGITTLEGNTFIDSAGSVNMILTGGDGNSKNIIFRKATGPTQQALIQTIGDDLRFFTGPSEAARFNSSGNLAFPSGQGIDFSATSGIGTSELFDDYEEGTWTPEYTTDGTDFDSVTYDPITYGWYTKIGNMVAVGGRIRTDALTVGSGTGNVVISGLPFSITKQSGIAIGYAASFVTKFPQFVEAPQGQTYIKLYGLASLNASSTTLTTANMNTGSNTNYLTFSGVYQV